MKCTKCKGIGRNPNDTTVICFNCSGTGEVSDSHYVDLLKRVEALEVHLINVQTHLIDTNNRMMSLMGGNTIMAHVPRMNCKFCGGDLCHVCVCSSQLGRKIEPDHVCPSCYEIGARYRGQAVAALQRFDKAIKGITADWQNACDHASQKEQHDAQ